MTDVVERLRMWAEYGPARTFGAGCAKDAVKEIERLRAALTKIRDDGKNCADHCRHQARRALSLPSQQLGGLNDR